MPRKNPRRPRDEPPRPASTTTPIPAPAGWTAQRIQTREAGPDYTCPRCKRTVTRASEHIVAWPEDEQHRHWHASCFASAVREGIDRYRWG